MTKFVFDVINNILCWGVIRAGVGVLVSLAKRYDKDHGLPEQMSRRESLLIIFAGCCVTKTSIVTAILNCFLLIYLCFSAYTDHHTKMVYSSGAYLIGVVGIFALLCRNRSAWMIVFGFYGVILLLTLCKAWSIGDAEILMATAPYLIIDTAMPIWALGSFLLLLEVLFLVYAFVICKAKPREYCAMSPALAMAAIIIL